MSKPTRMYGCLPRWVEWSIGLGIVAVTVVMLWPSYGIPRRSGATARQVACAARMVTLVSATRAYAQDNNGRLPNAAQWQDAMAEFVDGEGELRCPARQDDPLPHYALNPSSAGMNVADVGDRDKVVLLYEADALGLPVSPHKGRGNYAFMDGDIEYLERPPEGSGLPAREE